MLPTCDTENFVAKLGKARSDESTRNLIAPLLVLLRALEPEIARVVQTLAGFTQKGPILNLCATVPGEGLIVAATFVSVIDKAKRFKNAHAVTAGGLPLTLAFEAVEVVACSQRLSAGGSAKDAHPPSPAS